MAQCEVTNGANSCGDVAKIAQTGRDGPTEGEPGSIGCAAGCVRTTERAISFIGGGSLPCEFPFESFDQHFASARNVNSCAIGAFY